MTLVIWRPPAAVSNAAVHMHSKVAKQISAKLEIKRKNSLFSLFCAMLLPDHILNEPALLRMRYLDSSRQMSTLWWKL